MELRRNGSGNGVAAPSYYLLSLVVSPLLLYSLPLSYIKASAKQISALEKINCYLRSFFKSIIFWFAQASRGIEKYHFFVYCILKFQGEANGHLLRIYSTLNNSLDLVREITLTGSVMDVVYSPDQKYLCTADSNRKVYKKRLKLEKCFFEIIVVT